MYAAKSSGKNCFQVFQTEMRSRVVERLELTNSLHGALNRSEFPFSTSRISHVTTIACRVSRRWPAGVIHGLGAPAEFIPIAEETGIIVALGRATAGPRRGQLGHRRGAR